MRVTTRRLLEEQMAVVVASDSGTKDDAMWHVPHIHTILSMCVFVAFVPHINIFNVIILI